MASTAGSAKMTRGSSTSACPGLPDEIVEDILSRLLVRSLRRFQCVSRWFRAAIASRAFQDAHFQQRSRGGYRRAFVKPARLREPFHAWQLGGGGPAEQIMSTSHLPQGSIFPVAAKSCRGLVLLSCLESHTHHVWNPSTRETWTLPDAVPLRVVRDEFSPSVPLVTYGLGYCSATRRHKAVRMYRVRGGCHGGSAAPAAATVCEVLTIGGSACWRPPAGGPPPQHWPLYDWRRGAALCNGVLHFLQEGGDITTFNVTDETFGVLRPPPELQSCSNFELTELDGCLCAYTFTENWNWTPIHEPFHYTCEIWLLRDHVANGSWEKLCCIDWRTMLDNEHPHLMTAWIAPLDMYTDGNNQKKIMFCIGGSTDVFVMDLHTGTMEVIFALEDTILGECCNDQLPTVGLFEESLFGVGDT